MYDEVAELIQRANWTADMILIHIRTLEAQGWNDDATNPHGRAVLQQLRAMAGQLVTATTLVQDLERDRIRVLRDRADAESDSEDRPTTGDVHSNW